jgi:ATP-dependent Clp protease protease subunit
MARLNKDSVDRFLEHGLWIEGRTIYLGANGYHAVSGLEEYGADEISPFTAEQVIKALAILDSQNQDRPIQIILNSPGGDIYQGFAIYDALKRCESEVIITATGQCQSAASIILQAGDQRLLTPHCVVMVHDGQDGYSGHPTDFKNWAKIGDKINQMMYQIYSEASGKPASYWAKKCKSDYILLPSEAIAEGLADSIVG